MTDGRFGKLEAIRELHMRYCKALDEYDIARVARCFATDAVADYGAGRGGPIAGRAAIGERIALGQSVFRRTHHQLGQVQIDLDRDPATSIAYVTAWHQRDPSLTEIVCARYVDTLANSGGSWFIQTRRVEVSLTQGFPPTDWHWVKRQDPA